MRFFTFSNQNLLIFLLSLLTITVRAGDVNLLYFVSDDTDRLYSIDRNTGIMTDIGPCGVNGIEALAIWPRPGNNILYAADDGQLGTLNLTTGAFTALPNEFDGGGTANGALGPQTLDDVDGLTFDPWTGILWGSERKGAANAYDLIFQIDKTTGLCIPNAFGPGVDYIVVDGVGVYYDVDDIAINAQNGLIYAVSNDGGPDKLININKVTGATTVIGDLTFPDVEGLSFHSDNSFYGSTGTGGGASANSLYIVDINTGAMTLLYDLSAIGATDVEALATLVADANLISGTVWNDLDLNQSIDLGEPMLSAVKVDLYLDKNGNGILDGPDILIQTANSDVAGFYSFEYANTGSLIVKVDQNSLPVGFALTTTDRYVVTFNDNINFGETSANNDFGAAGGPDCDGDGIPDFYEGLVDSDGDGVLNMCDTDSDNDGIPDAIEYTNDCDGDGILNYIDLDSDNDGIPDAIEANDGVAPTGYNPNTARIDGFVGVNGMVDAIETAPESGISTSPLRDHDGDAIRDYCDLDSDNDGILDIIEAGGIDNNGDGQVESFADANADGYHDPLNSNPLAIPNSDGLTGPNYIDIDSDNDGIDDTREGYSSPSYDTPTFLVDSDKDGIIDFWDVSYGSFPITPFDRDSDGTPDYIDLDTDNDSILDEIEGFDVNRDGIVDVAPAGVDTDGDGLDDNYDPAPATWGNYTTMALQDYDNDGWQDWRDIDDDNDGILTVLEPTDDDSNTIVDYLEFNDNCVPVGPFVSGNAVAVISTFDFGTASDALGAVDGNFAQSPGVSNSRLEVELSYQVPVNKNINLTMRTSGGDGNAQFSIAFSPDNVFWSSPQVQLINTGGGFMVFSYTVPSTQGARYVRIQRIAAGGTADLDIDAYEFSFQNCFLDNDNDGIADNIDVDDDNDGILDVVEACGVGAVSFACVGGDPMGDDDNDGLYNYQDADFCTLNANGVCASLDNDGDGIINSLDLDADNDGIPDVVEAGGADADGDGIIDGFVDTNNDGVTDVFNPCVISSFSTRINNDTDDAEEDATGIMDLNSSDLELVEESTIQTVGMRFTGINIPVGAIITNAYIQFTVDETSGSNGPLLIVGESNVNPATFSNTNFDISSRTATTPATAVAWSPDNATWDVIGEATLDQRTPNLASIVQEIVDLGSWASGNPMVFIVSGTGERTAEAHDGDPNKAARLVVEYTMPCLANSIPTPDTDGDGLPDYLDLDADNDGIPDLVEAGGVDVNGDGLVDNATDNDGDGYADVYDTNDDGKVGIEDPFSEALVITGTDGDGDALPDSYPNGDTDGDGILDHLDLDADNDGIADVVEAGGVDVDGNGLADNYVDSDNDGFNDVVDGDVGNDGIAENSDNAQILTGADTNGDGRPESFVRGDHDGDGIPNYLDLDADNDGIADVVEGNGVDANGDGLADNYVDSDNDGFNDVVDGDVGNDGISENTSNVQVTTGVDANNDGKPDNYPVANLDGDALPNYLDLDADNDGVQDILEVGGVDANGDGLVDGYTDTDNDGWSQNVDGDLNNDGTVDNLAAVLITTGSDGNNDGRPDDYPQDNADGHGMPNFLDLDSDNDGITDVVENASGVTSGAANTDAPAAGSLDGFIGVGSITDGNANGWHDGKEGSTSMIDTDGDGVPDMYDIDADNDGIPDFLEGTCSTCPTFALPSGADLNGNGVLDTYENLFANNENGGTNTGVSPNEDNDDGTNPPDYLDLDTDNDTFLDWMEGFDLNGDGNSAPEIQGMAIDYVTNGGPITDYPATDTDLDGLPDWLDNMPNTFGYNPAIIPPFLDPVNAAWVDLDNDGLVDLFDFDINGNAWGTLAPVPDADAINDRDWRDINTYVDLPVEWLYFEAERQNIFDVQLDWATASEENSKGFIVERMLDNQTEFKTIGFVESVGNTNTTSTYSFEDANSYSGISYYRLQQVDLNGSTNYSETRAVEGLEEGNFVSVYPNPTTDHVIISLGDLSSSISTVRVTLIDVLGRQLVEFEKPVFAHNTIELNNLANYPGGVYYIRLLFDNGVELQREIVIKK